MRDDDEALLTAGEATDGANEPPALVRRVAGVFDRGRLGVTGQEIVAGLGQQRAADDDLGAGFPLALVDRPQGSSTSPRWTAIGISARISPTVSTKAMAKVSITCYP